MKQRNKITMLSILMIVIIVGKVSSLQWYQQGDPVFLNPTNFQQKLKQNSTAYKVIKFFTPYCRYCRYLKQVIEQIKAKSPREDVLFYQFNCQAYPNQCMRFGIRSYPHMDIYGLNGQKLDALHGFHQLQVVSSWMDHAMPKKEPQKPVQPQVVAQTKQQSRRQPQQPQSQLIKQQQTKQKVPDSPIKQDQGNSKKDKLQVTQKQQTQQEQQKQHQVVSQEMNKNDQNIEKIADRQQKEQIKKIESQQMQPPSDTVNKKEQRSYFKFFIYIAAGGIGIYYFSHIMKSKDNPHQHDQTNESRTSSSHIANGFTNSLKQTSKRTKLQMNRLQVSQSSMNDDVQIMSLKQAAASVRDQDL